MSNDCSNDACAAQAEICSIASDYGEQELETRIEMNVA